MGPFIVLLIGVAIVYLVSRFMRLRPAPLVTEISRRDLTLVLWVVLAVGALITLYRILFHTVVLPFLGRPIEVFDATELLFDIVRAGVILLPLIVLMRLTGLSRKSIGIKATNLRRLLILGAVPSAVLVTVYALLSPAIGARFVGISAAHGYAALIFLLGAAVEEILWRGYVQTRLVAWIGPLPGLTITSLVFALWHFPVRFYVFSGVVSDALASTLLVFPVGVLFGYFMLRSQNVLPGTIFHAIINLTPVFFPAPVS